MAAETWKILFRKRKEGGAGSRMILCFMMKRERAREVLLGLVSAIVKH